MSHITDIRLRILDLDALAEAGPACGLEFRRDQKSIIWWGRFVGDTRPNMTPEQIAQFGRVEHALRLEDHQQGDYEIGVVKALDGGEGFDLVMDTFGQRRLLGAVGGEAFGKLRREYAAAVALRKAKKQLGPKGFVAKREDLPNGRIRLRMVKR